MTCLVTVSVSIGFHPAHELMPAHLRAKVHHVDIMINGETYRKDARDAAHAAALASNARRALGLEAT
jgi:hypothetical protein